MQPTSQATSQSTRPEAVNVVVLRGDLSSAPRPRTLPSGDLMAQLEVTTRGDDVASVPVVAFGALARRAGRYEPGAEVVVVGVVRRRFFRAGGATQSRTEVVAHRLVRGRDHRAVARAFATARALVAQE